MKPLMFSGVRAMHLLLNRLIAPYSQVLSVKGIGFTRLLCQDDKVGFKEFRGAIFVNWNNELAYLHFIADLSPVDFLLRGHSIYSHLEY